MLPLHVTLSYYKRKDIREAMAALCRDKEVAIRYDSYFGKRPDVIIYDSDILSFAQKKASSFHVSEETWNNPLQLSPNMARSEINDLRIGWDLILDIDFPIWEVTQVITDRLIKQLVAEGLPSEAISVKFSGNKGFHIGVPFEAFPYTYTDEDGNEILTSDLFPDGVRRMVEYIVHKVDGPDNSFALSKYLVENFDLNEHLVRVCVECGKRAKNKGVAQAEFLCKKCGHYSRSDAEYLSCEKCGMLMERKEFDTSSCSCGSSEFTSCVDLNVDTMLVSSRHMYRLAYSLHEKSGLASIPIPIDTVLTFDRQTAQPQHVTTDIEFLSRDVPVDCGSKLLHNALMFLPPGKDEVKPFTEITWVGDAAPEEVFPPPIRKMLEGMQDGRKRALFVLTNFLMSVGWSYEMIEARLHEWNKKNAEPLREVNLKGHLRYHKQKGQIILPPNFDNDMYYCDLGVLQHDELSQRVKNPVQYVRLRLKQAGVRTSKQKLKAREIEKAIRFIRKNIPNNVVWRFEGSTNLYVQGMRVPVMDIDVTMRRSAIPVLQSAFKEVIVKEQEKKSIDAYVITCKLDDTEIEFLCRDDKKYHMLQHGKKMKWKNMLVPILPLSFAAQFYDLIERPQKASFIREFIANTDGVIKSLQ